MTIYGYWEILSKGRKKIISKISLLLKKAGTYSRDMCKIMMTFTKSLLSVLSPKKSWFQAMKKMRGIEFQETLTLKGHCRARAYSSRISIIPQRWISPAWLFPSLFSVWQIAITSSAYSLSELILRHLSINCCQIV